MMSSYLAWTLLTTGNQIWKKQWVGRRKEETWRALEQLEYSWERGHVHRERLKQAISGPAPLSPHSHTIMYHPHPSLSLLIHLSPPQQGSVILFPSGPLNSWSHILHWRMGAVRWVGVSDWAITEDCRRKWLHRLLSLDFSSVRLCCSWSVLRLRQDEKRAWTVCNGISMLY